MGAEQDVHHRGPKLAHSDVGLAAEIHSLQRLEQPLPGVSPFFIRTHAGPEPVNDIGLGITEQAVVSQPRPAG